MKGNQGCEDLKNKVGLDDYLGQGGEKLEKKSKLEQVNGMC